MGTDRPRHRALRGDHGPDPDRAYSHGEAAGEKEPSNTQGFRWTSPGRGSGSLPRAVTRYLGLGAYTTDALSPTAPEARSQRSGQVAVVYSWGQPLSKLRAGHSRCVLSRREGSLRVSSCKDVNPPASGPPVTPHDGSLDLNHLLEGPIS